MIPRLDLDAVRVADSPFQDDRPADATVDALVLHGDGMPSGCSAHYRVDGDGTVWRMVPERRRAFHAGDGVWRGRGDLDDRSVAIEVASPGHRAMQMAALCELCLAVLARHPIPARNVVGHGDVAPAREGGGSLDWMGLARNGVGLWPEVDDEGDAGVAGDAEALRPVRADLLVVGYDVEPEGAHDAALGRVLRAFQAHWRPESVTGLADAGTRARLRALRALI